MSNTSALHTEPIRLQSGPALTNRSLWFSLLLALLLIAVLLFAFNAPTIAAPIDTTIGQRIQNSALTSGSTVTATYGEVLSVTMRFTVTAGTFLPGPITVTTRFAGWTTPNNQYGYRFLGYQGPMTVATGSPDLTGVNFVSNTIAGTTYLTWTFNTIDNSAGLTSAVYEIPYQVRLVWDGIADTGGSTAIPNPANTTAIAWTGGGGSPKTANNLTVFFRRPDLSYSTKVYRAIPDVRGGATVVYTITLKNGNSPTNFSPAYNLALTDTLDAHLTYVSASPVPSNVIVAPGQPTQMIWNPASWSLLPNASALIYVTATLPVTIPANPGYLNSAMAAYTTLSGGSVPDEAGFTNTFSTTVVGGIAGSKRAFPTDNVRIGDSVNYTVQFTVSANVYLRQPVFTDTLPDGFHYRSGSLSANGATLNGTPTTTPSGTKELLGWQFNDIALSGSPQVVTVGYIADATGLNANGTLAYSTTAQLSTKQPASNLVQAAWKDTAGTTLGFVSPLASTALVAQPYLNNTDFNVSISGWTPFTASQEVGSTASYTISVRNTGPITAYEVVLSNSLPAGVIYQGNIQVQPINLPVVLQPSPGATGVISFVLQQLTPSDGKATITFDAIVGNSAKPGDALADRLSLLDYSSQPNGQGVADRSYGTIAAAIPAPKAYTFTLKGLTAIKTDAPDPVQPGQLLTYSIYYSNTSALYAATNAILVDTYDEHLTYLNSTSNPGVPDPLYDPSLRTLTWNVGTLNPNSTASSRITATFQVEAPIPTAVRVLTNMITSDWDSPAPAMLRYVTTTLVQPIPTISLDDKGISVQANQLMTYTMIYSNASKSTGATTGTFTVTLDYAPYLTFITSTGRLPLPGTGGTIFTDTLGAGVTRTVLLRMQVARPLPYDLYKTGFTSTATIYQPSVDISATDSEQTDVLQPIFDLVQSKVGNLYTGPGDSVTYNIYVTNTSSITGTNIVITDVWDPNTTSPAGVGWVIAGSYAVYTIPQLAPGATFALPQFTVVVKNPLPPDAQQIHNILQLSSRDTTQQVSTYDIPVKGLFIQKTHTPDPVYPGTVLTYTIAYTMYGTTAAAPVITDTLPGAVSYLNCSVDHTGGIFNGACSHPASNLVVWSWTTLPQDTAGVVTVTVQAPAAEWITLTNRYASNSLSGALYREGPPDYTYVGRPHMSITKRAVTAVTPAAPGDLITYTLTYTNSGSYKATGAVAYDTVPANTTFVSCSGAPCSASSGAGVVNWTIGEVPITTTGTLAMIVRVKPNAGTTTIVNNAYSLTADRNVVNENTPSAVNVAVVRPALAVSKSASPTWMNGTVGLITYTVRYTNTGGGLLTNLNFVDPLYAKTLFQSTSPNCANSSPTPPSTVSCTDVNLAPGQSRQFTITVKGNGVSNNEVITNAVTYWASDQTETLPPATTRPIEVLVSNAGAAADFAGVPISGTIPLNVTFTNLSSADSGVSITNICAWDFGDGGTSTNACTPGNQVNHLYSRPGVYTVMLTIHTNFGGGISTRTRASYIAVGGFQIYLPLLKK